MNIKQLREVFKKNGELQSIGFPRFFTLGLVTDREALTAKDVFDAAKAGDAVALNVVDEVCEILGAALSNIACVVDPEIIVIGGGVSKAGEILTDGIRTHFAAHAFSSCKNTKFALAGQIGRAHV